MNKRKRIILGTFGILLIVGGGTCGFVYHSHAQNHIKIHQMRRTRAQRSKHLKLGKHVIHHKYHVRNNKKQKHKLQFSMNPSDWRKGTPAIFQQSSLWVTNYQPYRNVPKYKYVRYCSTFSKKLGFNPIAIYYTSKKKSVFNTNGLGAKASVHPYYQSLGHNFYRIVSGAVRTNGLKNDLHAIRSKSYGEAILVQVNGSDDINIWEYKNGKPNSKKKRYIGEFQRYPNTLKEFKKILQLQS